MAVFTAGTRSEGLSAITAAQDGDTVRLGNITMGSLLNGTPIAKGVTIEGGYFTKIQGDWNKVTFRKQSVRPNGIGYNTTAVILRGDDCTIYEPDIDCRDGSLWTARDWTQRSTGGIMFYGSGCQVLGGAMYAVRTGAVAQHSSKGARFEGLRIEGICGDAFRPNGAGSRVANCYVTDTWAVDGNHDDMVQAFALDPATGRPTKSMTHTVDDVQIVGNEFYSCDDPKNEIWTRTEEPGPINMDAPPLISAGQGIWMGDGAPHNWLVDGNLLVLTPWKHGISLGHAVNCRVTNNRVIDGNPNFRGRILRIFVQRGNGNAVTGNEAPVVASGWAGNLEIPPSEYANHYVDPAKFDFRPKGALPTPVPVPEPPPVVVDEPPVDEPQEPLPPTDDTQPHETEIAQLRRELRQLTGRVAALENKM